MTPPLAAHPAAANAVGVGSAATGWERSRGTSYGAARTWVATHRGKAAGYRCVECGGPARVWSYDGTDPEARTGPRGCRYSLDPGCYRPCCRSCSRRGPTTAQTRAARRARLCEVTGCGRRHLGHGYCRTHLARRDRTGDARADVPVEARTLGGVSYWSVHHRLGVERGPAAAQACAECGAPALSWSYDGTDPDERTDPTRGYRYSLDPTRYRPRCRPCHRRATLAASPARPGSAVVEVERAVWLYQRGVGAPGIAARLGVSRTAVYTALRTHGVPIRARSSRAPLRSPTVHTDSSS